MDQSYPKHVEQFEVVLLKDGASEFTAKADDFKRVAVDAIDPLAAMLSEQVGATKGFHALSATKPGVLTDPEVNARRRDLEGPAVDRSKI